MRFLCLSEGRLIQLNASIYLSKQKLIDAKDSPQVTYPGRMAVALTLRWALLLPP